MFLGLKIVKSNLSGKFLSNFFFSSPTKLVHSYLLLFFPLPSNFSQTLNVTPQEFITFAAFFKCSPFGPLAFLNLSSRKSRLIAANRKFLSRISNVIWYVKFPRFRFLYLDLHHTYCMYYLLPSTEGVIHQP